MRKSVDGRSKKKKGESDIRLNNPDLLRAVVTSTSISVRWQVIKSRIGWDIKKYLTLINSMQRFYPTLMEK